MARKEDTVEVVGGTNGAQPVLRAEGDHNAPPPRCHAKKAAAGPR